MDAGWEYFVSGAAFVALLWLLVERTKGVRESMDTAGAGVAHESDQEKRELRAALEQLRTQHVALLQQQRVATQQQDAKTSMEYLRKEGMVIARCRELLVEYPFLTLGAVQELAQRDVAIALSEEDHEKRVDQARRKTVLEEAERAARECQ